MCFACVRMFLCSLCLCGLFLVCSVSLSLWFDEFEMCSSGSLPFAMAWYFQQDSERVGELLFHTVSEKMSCELFLCRFGWAAVFKRSGFGEGAWRSGLLLRLVLRLVYHPREPNTS